MLARAAGGVVVCVQSAPDWRAWLNPVLVLLSLCIAWLALRNTRSVARQKATLDLIEKKESTEHYRALSRRFSELRRGPGFAHLNDPVAGDKADRQVVIDFLNHYEIVAIGIRQNILDARIYRAWMEGAFVRDWNAARDWIQRERWKARVDGSWEYRGSIYGHYQSVACAWSREAVALDAGSSGPPGTPAGPGDEALPRPAD